MDMNVPYQIFSLFSLSCVLEIKLLLIVSARNGSGQSKEIVYLIKAFKHIFLDLVPRDIRFIITKVRISAHSLRIHTGRYGECLYCNLNDIQGMYNFVYYYVRPSVFN